MLEKDSLDPRIVRTRQMLEEALLTLMQKKPFHNIAVGDITEQAGVNRSTFYAHYTDKYDLLDYCVRETFRAKLAEALPKSSEFCCDKLKPLIVATCAYLERLNGGCSPVDKQLDPIVENQVQSQLYEYIFGWLNSVGQQAMQHAVLPETTALVLSWAIFGVGRQWAEKSSAQTPEELAEQVYALITQGILQLPEGIG